MMKRIQTMTLAIAGLFLGSGQVQAGTWDQWDVSAGEVSIACAEQVVGFQAPLGNEGGVPHYFKVHNMAFETNVGGDFSGVLTDILPNGAVLPMTCAENGFQIRSDVREQLITAFNRVCSRFEEAVNQHPAVSYQGACDDNDAQSFGAAVTNYISATFAKKLPATPQSFTVNWSQNRKGFAGWLDRIGKQAWGNVQWLYHDGTAKTLRTGINWGAAKIAKPDAQAVAADVDVSVNVPLINGEMCFRSSGSATAIAFYANRLIGFTEVINMYNCSLATPDGQFFIKATMDMEARSEWTGQY